MEMNLHTHSPFCDHAAGSLKEYADAAVSMGFKTFGFSDHAPYTFPNGFISKYRVPPCNAKKYISDIEKIREAYKDKINILAGFEMEYYPSYFEDMLKYVYSLGAQYLILGQHYITDEVPNGRHSSTKDSTEDMLKTFTDNVIAGMKTGVYTYVAHPDMLNYSGDKDFYREQAERMCKASKQYDIPLEINLLGVRDNRHYPNPNFWSVVGEQGCKVVLGLDAHEPQSVTNKEAIKKGEDFAASFGIKILNDIPVHYLKDIIK